MWKSSKPGFTPSSSTFGFFVERPRLPNQAHEDRALDRVRKLYLPQQVNSEISPELERFGDLALSPKVLTLINDAEKNLPYLHTYSTFGQRQDVLICSEGWRELQNLTIKEGIVAIPYESAHAEFSRVHQFAKYHLWSGSNAGVTCPSAMSDGAASFLKRHLATIPQDDPKRPVLQAAYNNLISREPTSAWTSGQWMTERPGGSDVSRSETVAIQADTRLEASVTAADGQPLGDWSINGFKWFSSATDADMTILLARTPEGKLSTFFAPMRRTVPSSSSQHKIQESELNGVKLIQLKRKLGTKPLPTAELELNDMRAYLLGEAGNGIREISTILNITRVHNSVTSVGDWGRGLAIKRAFARVRTVAGGKPLWKMPAHTAIMARDEVGYRGWMNIAFFTVFLLGLSENPGSTGAGIDARLAPRPEDVQNLLRVLTPVLKAGSAKACITGLQECVEGLGGVGFCENEDQDLNVARIYRDANVLSIWEGTTETLAWDLVKILKGRNGKAVLKSLHNWVEDARPSDETKHAWMEWAKGVMSKSEDDLLIEGRFVSEELAKVVGSVLLEIDAARDNCPVAAEVATRWKAGTQDWKASPVGTLEERERMDARIVWGDEVALGGSEPKL